MLCLNDVGGSSNCNASGLGNFNTNCGSQAKNGNLSIPRTGVGANFDLAYALFGDVLGGQGTLNGVLSGADSPFVNCSVSFNSNQSGNCVPKPGNGFGTQNFGANNTVAFALDVNSNICTELVTCQNNTANFTLTLSCTCGNG